MLGQKWLIYFNWRKISNARMCYMPSIKRELSFKPLTTADVKTLSRIGILSDFDINKNVNYIYEVNNQLYKVENNNQIFKELNEYLKNNNVSIKGIINDELQRKIDNNLIISNIFGNFKEFFEVNEEDLFSKVSETEKLFLKDPVYKKMTNDSKKLYRKRLLKLAKKKKMEEYNYLKSIYNSEEHIGYKLFPHKNNTLRVIIYILSIILSTVGISFFLSGFFGKWQILGFIILLIPISQLIVQIVNEILLHNVSIKEIPKLDFSKGIPEEHKTMVVIPTIVSDVEKVKEIFDVLESFCCISFLFCANDGLYRLFRLYSLYKSILFTARVIEGLYL